MKKILFISGLALALSAAVAAPNAYAGKLPNINEANTRVVTAFNLYFPNAAKVTWLEKDNAYTAYFTRSEGDRGTAEFDRKGRLVFTVLYHRGTDLPVNIGMRLKDDYKGFNVQNVVEYTDSDKHFYFVMLESRKELVRIRIGDAGQSVEMERFRKA